MILFPLTKPRLGLSITGKTLGIAEIHRGWNHATFQRYHELPVPSNAVCPSPTAANLTNPDGIRDVLRTLRQDKSRPQTVALCLPDVCARSTVFRFSSLPSSASEREAIIGGRFQQDLRLSPSNLRIAYRIYHKPEKLISETDHVTLPLHVLAVAIQRDIIESYETLCLQVGLVPSSITLAGLAVFDLCRAAMEKAAQAIHSKVFIDMHETFFLFLADWGFSLFIFRDGHPMFFRVKSIPMFLQSDMSLAETSHPSPESTEEEISAPSFTRTVNLVANEFIATIQYYFDTIVPDHTFDEEPIKASPLFLVGSPEPEQILPQIGQTVEQLLAGHSDSVPLLHPIPLHSGTEGLSGTSFSWLKTCYGTALPPFAATVMS